MGAGQHLQAWQEKQVAKEIAAGTDHSEIMSDWDICKSTVQAIKTRQRDLIAAEGEKYLAALPDAIEIQKKLIAEINNDLGSPNDVVRSEEGNVVLDHRGKPIHNRLSKRDPTLFKAGVSASENALKAAGVLPSQNLSMNVQNVYNDNKTQVVSPVIMGMLGKMFDGDEEVVDAEVDVEVDRD